LTLDSFILAQGMGVPQAIRTHYYLFLGSKSTILTFRLNI
jgi:hypothetical protein